jgi:hypothetical protein
VPPSDGKAWPMTATVPSSPASLRGGGLLRHRDVRLLLAGQAVSELGSQVGSIALPLVAVQGLRASPLQLGAGGGGAGRWGGPGAVRRGLSQLPAPPWSTGSGSSRATPTWSRPGRPPSYIAQVSYWQALCPPGLLGRMNASSRFLVFGALPLGGLLGGLAGERLGVRPTLWLWGIGLALTPVPLLLSPLGGAGAAPGRR